MPLNGRSVYMHKFTLAHRGNPPAQTLRPHVAKEARNGSQKPVSDVRAYIAKITSIQGENGSAGLCRVVQACTRAGLCQAEAMREVIVWNDTNPNVRPKWSLDEITHAVERVYRVNGK